MINHPDCAGATLNEAMKNGMTVRILNEIEPVITDSDLFLIKLNNYKEITTEKFFEMVFPILVKYSMYCLSFDNSYEHIKYQI